MACVGSMKYLFFWGQSKSSSSPYRLGFALMGDVWTWPVQLSSYVHVPSIGTEHRRRKIALYLLGSFRNFEISKISRMGYIYFLTWWNVLTVLRCNCCSRKLRVVRYYRFPLYCVMIHALVDLSSADVVAVECEKQFHTNKTRFIPRMYEVCGPWITLKFEKVKTSTPCVNYCWWGLHTYLLLRVLASLRSGDKEL